MPETLATIRHWAGQCPAFDWSSISQELRVPASEMTQSPISAKIAVLGFNDGRIFHHSEGRGILPVHSSRAPDFESAAAQWSQGRLVLPKYASFALESASPPFNPNHRCKWRPHELLHSLCRFFWRPDMTRFEAYIGARISELLPVVHWYGLDEIYRRRCPVHVGQVLYREFCPECESLAQDSWQIDVTTQCIAESFLFSSIQHFQREIAAIDEELRTGQMVPIRGGQLDSSSDAIGYVRGHWARLNDQWTAECVLQCYQQGRDYFAQLSEHRDWVFQLFEDLLQASPLPAQNKKLGECRRRQDWAQRLAYLAPFFSSADEAELVSYFAAIGDPTKSLAGVLEAVDDHLKSVHNGEHHRKAFFADGVVVQQEQQLTEGLISAYPETFDCFPELFDSTQIAAFSSSTVFWTAGSLASRFFNWSQAALTADQCAWMQLEMAIRDQQQPDLLCDVCAGEVDVERLAEGEWRWNTSIVEVEVTPRIAKDVFEVVTAQSLTVLCAIFCGEAMVLPLDDELFQIWQSREHLALVPQLLPMVEPFLELGMLWWFVPAR